MEPKTTIGVELFGALSIMILTAFRIYIQRNRPRRKMGCFYAYETCLSLALLCNLYITGVDVWSSFRQLNRNLPANMSQKELSQNLIDSTFMKMFFAGGICYTWFLWLVKGSFIAVYFEISTHFVKRVRYMLYGVTVFVIVTFVVNILMKFLWCMPFNRNWSLGPDRCTFTVALPVNTCTAFFNIATDIARNLFHTMLFVELSLTVRLVMAFFVVVVNSLQLDHRELIAAVFVGAIGFCTIIAAAVRYGVAYTSFKDSDASWRNTKRLLFWTNVEMGLVIVAVTLPACRVILRRTHGSSGAIGYSSEFPNKSLGGEIGLGTMLSGRGAITVTTQIEMKHTAASQSDSCDGKDKDGSESCENLWPPGKAIRPR
ncbi:hypothetical protein EX30DRAFT_365955 [Ascodesmis nigricans]|uniref:Rhodopsin domain-containing protein n=1 Tax=Ascodesmis nigricans TaxID=341454 RepID=A0A4S2MS61_9PEZI|nr:hypothetical protein EX30DRAFT_365955 [Ascodesmis nigricans]